MLKWIKYREISIHVKVYTISQNEPLESWIVYGMIQVYKLALDSHNSHEQTSCKKMWLYSNTNRQTHMHTHSNTIVLQWNLYITDTLVQDTLSIIQRCPLLGGWVWLITKVDDVI